jgi:FtsH-binding integral membrane protein
MSQPYKNFDPYAAPADMFAIDAQLGERLAFLRKVYAHVFGAILLMVGMEALLFMSGLNLVLLQYMGQSWLISLIVFMAVSWFAERLAFSGASAVAQYSGLALYVGVQSLITAPVLTIATLTNPALIGQAGFITLAITGGLTLFVVFSKADFSFMRNALFLASIALMVLAVASAIFGFSPGLGFAVAMVMLMCGYILYQTSAVLHHLPTTAHVAGALMLFSSIVTLFREILYIMMKLNDD